MSEESSPESDSHVTCPRFLGGWAMSRVQVEQPGETVIKQGDHSWLSLLNNQAAVPPELLI